MNVDVELKVNAKDKCGDSNMEDPVVSTTEAKVKFHGSFIVGYFRAVSIPGAFAFAFVRPVNLFSRMLRPAQVSIRKRLSDCMSVR